MDLFSLCVTEEKLHKNFRNILSDGHLADRHELQRWSEGFPDRDKKFVKEFQTTFNSSFWEIYLFAFFRKIGAKFDFNHQSPDFSLELSGEKIVVEAAIAAAASGKTPEWERPLSGMAPNRVKKMNIESIIRLSNAICTKYKKYKNEYSSLPHLKSKPFILAIAPFEQPHFNLQYDGPITALLYDQYTDEDASFDDPEKYPEGMAPVINLGTVEKDNGAEIELGFFNDPRFSEISAVILSTTATWGKVAAMSKNPDVQREIGSVWWSESENKYVKKLPSVEMHVETLQDGIMVFHNNYAKFPLKYDLFDMDGIVQIVSDPLTGRVIRQRNGNCLVSRVVNSYMGSNNPNDFD